VTPVINKQKAGLGIACQKRSKRLHVQTSRFVVARKD
jgi:hypothetical protein